MSEPIRDIVIVGGGLAGWYCAAKLGHALRGRRVKLTVVHAAPSGSAADPLDVFCASTLPATVVSQAALGLDERQFMRETQAAFKLATEFRGFGAPPRSYLLPFGEIGARLEAVGFHQFLARILHTGRMPDIDEFSVPAIAARLGRFAHPSQDPRSVLSTYEYAYHLDVGACTALLRGLATRDGAMPVEGELARVECDAERRNVRAVVLGDGTRITGDLFIDCTGARAELIGKALGVPFDSWREWLPCDYAVAVRTRASTPPAPYTRVTAQPGGWAWQVPLRGSLEQALVFDSRHRDPQSVLAQASAQGEALSAPRSLSFANGRRREAWTGNCVAVGAAAGFLEPLVSTGLQLIDEGVRRLVNLLPDRDTFALMAMQYNRELAAAYDGARDFAALFHLPRQAGQTPPLPESLPATLRQRLELFRYRGRVVLHDDEIIEEADWACVFIGLGEWPRHHSVLTEQLDEQELFEKVGKVARVMAGAVQNLPPHDAYLERYLA